MVERLVINGRFLSASVSGVERYAIEMIRALDVAIAASPHARLTPPVTLLLPPNAVAVPGLVTIETRSVGRLTGHFWEQLELPWHARGSTLLSLGGTGPVMACNHVVTIHDAAVFAIPEAYRLAFTLWYRTMLRVVGRRAIRVITPSKFSRDELVHHLKIVPEKITVIPEGKEHILRTKSDKSILHLHELIAKQFVLVVGNMDLKKNLINITSAMEFLKDLNVGLVLVGRSYPRVFQDVPLKIAQSTKHLGYVTDAELRALYEAAACLVYPSRYEGFGLPPLEAMACGCPVIVSRAASLPEVCGEAALYCEARDPEDIAKQVRRLACNQALQHSLRARGLRRADMFSWVQCAEALWVELDHVLNRKGDTKPPFSK